MGKLKLPFTYRNVELVRVVDGDTVRLKVDTGFNHHYIGNFRLDGIDAQEKWQEGGPAATVNLQVIIDETIDHHDGLEVDVTKKDKYGRWLVVLRRAKDRQNLNERMITEGHAQPYGGGKRTSA